MKSTLVWIVAAIAVGLAGGVAVGYWEARAWTGGAAVGKATASAEAPPTRHEHDHGDGHDHDHDDAPQGPAEARAIVPETTYRFGNMESGTIQRHTFPVRNEGARPLTVTFVSHTCKCTGVRLDDEEIEVGASIVVSPGGEKGVELQWTAPPASGPFRHGATFTTTDDTLSRLELTVEGEIVASTTLQPSQLYFGSVNVQKPGTTSLIVMAFLEPEVTILSHEVLGAELAERVSITFEPVAQADLPNPQAKAGVKVTATYNPGGTLGPFGGSLQLVTNLKRAPTLDVPISGRVQGDISIYGPGWTDANGLLRMAPATTATGGVSRLNINVRGEHAGATELSVESVDPPALKVTLGERTAIRDGLVRVPLTVEIPPGTPPMVRVSKDQGGEAEIVLATTHPITSQVRLRVAFTVQP